MPPLIADADFTIPAELTVANETALLALGAMDAEAAGQSAAMARFLIRTESVASSKIERVSATVEDFARALAGNKSNSSAISMVAATDALGRMVDAAGASGGIAVKDVLRAHRDLMRDDLVEGPHAGRVRDSQNWIGGSDYSPLGALYVPPPADLVEELLDDLLRFANRDDLPTLAQATLAHAQFESIHPFGDGNGRIGRALIGAILRRRGVTRNTVVPVASGLLARREDYFDALSDYREGEPTPLLALILRASAAAAEAGRESIGRISAFPAEWAERVDARRGSAAAALIPAFFDNPVMGVDAIEAVTGVAGQAVYSGLARLEDAGIVQEITGRKRDKVWAASDLLGELNVLDSGIAARMRRR
ncbi:Fic family protein [Microbacterium testaceum]|uniref:Fic family protein n=1 Tax=Microbacterium testaceum TaxID=2033 RepID=UPI001FA7556F|nr:Fic family protein [Microbacterium testaceum]